MLGKYGITVSACPEDKDILEWTIEQKKIGKVSIKKLEPCKDCGSTKNIIEGFGRLVWHRITKGKPEQFIIDRAEICNECEHRTFLNVMEWGIGIVSHGDLPINHEYEPWDALWCSKCKCCIEAKIRVKGETCIEGKWDNAKA